jgi:hypothetical protein
MSAMIQVLAGKGIDAKEAPTRFPFRNVPFRAEAMKKLLAQLRIS